MKGKSYSKAITAAIVTQIFWGLSFFASSIGQESASPFVLMSYRFDIALFRAHRSGAFGQAEA